MPDFMADPTVKDDADLVARIRQGATEEFSQLVTRYQDRVFAILYRYEQDRQKLEDLAQETFVKVWRAMDQFNGRAPFEHWLSGITVRVALDHLRRERRRRPEIGLEDLGAFALDWLRSDAAEKELESRQAAEVLAVALRQLSPAEQVVITMQELEGRSVKEICERTGSSSIAVRVRASRARAKLRRILERMETDARSRKRP